MAYVGMTARCWAPALASIAEEAFVLPVAWGTLVSAGLEVAFEVSSMGESHLAVDMV